MDQEEEKTELIFVYGSLRRCGEKAYLLADAEFVCPALVQGTLYEISNSAALVMDSSGRFVTGELYKVHPALSELGKEELPGAGSGGCRMARAPARPYNLGQAEVEAWVWEWTGSMEDARLLKQADWMEHCIPRMPPLYTAIALCSLIALPGVMLAASVSNLPLKTTTAVVVFGWTIWILALLSPPMGLVTLVLADRRRERWGAIRPILYLFLGLASLPCLLFLISLLTMLGTTIP